MEELFAQAARTAGMLIEAVAVLVVAFGAGEACVGLVRLAGKPASGHHVRKAIWRRFGTWLLIGLEFALAADIIISVVSPTWRDIGQLAAIAAIRTFLNYFLEHDLEQAGHAQAA
jgi:uncharacterized membrane protein